jgi:hypothetical protein
LLVPKVTTKEKILILKNVILRSFNLPLTKAVFFFPSSTHTYLKAAYQELSTLIKQLKSSLGLVRYWREIM